MIVVPTIHPAALLRGQDDASGAARFGHVVLDDLRKAARLRDSKPLWDESCIWEPYVNFVPRSIFPTVQDVADFVTAAKQHGMVVVDVETSGEHALACQLICVGLGTITPSGPRVICVPFLSQGGTRYWTPGDEARVRELLRDLLGAPAVSKTFHNLAFDCVVLWAQGFPVIGWIDDTLQAHHVLDGEMPQNLGYVASRLLDTRFWKDDVKGAAWLSLDDMTLRSYNCRDVLTTLRLRGPLLSQVQQAGLTPLYHTELGIAQVMARGTIRGMAVDFVRRDSTKIDPKTGKPEGLGPRLRLQMNEALATLREIAGGPVDPLKPVHLRYLFFQQLGFRVMLETKTGLPATNKEALMLLALAANTPAQQAAVQALVDFRQAQKFLSTFVEGLTVLGDGRFHPTWNVLPVTGRLSSQPNAQNWPLAVKRIFCAGPGQKLVGVDLSQAELRLLAYVTKDKNLLEMYERGVNVHTANTALVFKVRAPLGHKDLDATTEAWLQANLPSLIGLDFDKLGIVSDKEKWKSTRTLTKNGAFGCLKHDTLVEVISPPGAAPFARQVQISAISSGMWTHVWWNGRREVTKIVRAWCTGRKPCVELLYREGDVHYSVTLTPDHRVILADGTKAPVNQITAEMPLAGAARFVGLRDAGVQQVWDLEVEHAGHNFTINSGSLFVSNSAYGAEDETLFSVMRSKRDPNGALLFPTITLAEVAAFRHRFTRELYPSFPKMWERVAYETQLHRGYQCPISGRKRLFRAGFKRNEMINFPIQCGVASHMNQRTLEIQDRFDRETGGAAQVIQQVHDALTVEAPADYAKRAGDVMLEILNRPFAWPGFPNAKLPADNYDIGTHLDQV